MRQRTDRILFGGDCNPEQWPEEIWEEDMRLFQRAHICELTRNVFSWGLLQPSEEQYDFSQLDRIMDLCRREGISVILATSTAAQPAWMSARYPETNRTDAHENRHHFGGRQNICPTSRVFRKYASALAGSSPSAMRDMTTSLPGTSPTSTAGTATAGTARRPTGTGCAGATAPSRT